MPSGYRYNQFVSDWLKPQTDEWQNAPFQYPRRIIRHTTVDEYGKPVRTAKQLDRGFIRNLMTDTISTAGVTTKQQRQRFNFQFNPSAIEQAVQMRQDIYLPILQDPTQFAQPMSAVASFNFDILLDRTMEVGAYQSVGVDGERVKTSQIDVDLFGESNPATDVYQIGVLSDLQVLYSIIGQGFSNKFIEAQLEQLKIQARLEASENEELGVTESDIDSITSESFSGAANFGNNAFLIPMPVRVVFSELFMVDGFITSTSVRFTKFNSSMVPIQASVGLSMNALYIGFAKQKTFLTVQLENAKNVQLTNAQTAIAEQAEIVELARQSANKFVFYCDKADEWVDMFSTSNDDPVPIYAYAKYADSVEEDYSKVRDFRVGFKDAKTQGNNDKIETYFENGGTSTFSYTWRFYIYGAYNNQGNAQVDLNGNQSRSPSSFVTAFTGIKRVAEYASSSKPTATDKDSWLRIRSDSINDDNDDLDSRIIGGTPLTGEPPDYSSKYFLVNLVGTVYAGTQSRDFNVWKVLRGDQQFKADVTLGWPTSMGMGGNNTSVSGVSGTAYANDNTGIRRAVGTNAPRS